ncbi:MAG: hypothetical protein RL310_898 [Actinomycetota bacterium]
MVSHKSDSILTTSYVNEDENYSINFDDIGIKFIAGFYDVNIIVSTTSNSDTLRYVFGLDAALFDKVCNLMGYNPGFATTCAS